MKDNKVLMPSMADRISELEADLAFNTITEIEFATLAIQFKDLFRFNIKLCHLIACDKDGKPMEEPEDYIDYIVMNESDPFFNVEMSWKIRCEEYEKAQEACLFEGFEIIDRGAVKSIGVHVTDEIYIHVFWLALINKGEWKLSHGLKTIEDLQKLTVYLTAQGVKRAGI